MFFNNNKVRSYKLGILSIFFLLTVSSCFNTNSGGNTTGNYDEEVSKFNDIHILFTGDTHGNEPLSDINNSSSNSDNEEIEEEEEKHVNHASLYEYKKDLLNKNNKVITIDLGDAIQGNTYTSITKGSYMIQNMNHIAYDISILGNHEFDYGITNLISLIEDSNSTYLNGNVVYKGKNEESSGNFLNELSPIYTIDYDYIKIGFFTLLTPDALYSGTPSIFKENDKTVYSFYETGINGNKFYERAQELVDTLKKDEKCDLVIGLTHLGDIESASIFNSRELIKRVEGIDVVLDGQAHNVIESEYVTYEGDKDTKSDDKEVLLSSLGAYFEYFGDLTIDYSINSDGVTFDRNIYTTLIDDYDENNRVLKEIRGLNNSLDVALKEKVATSEVDLSEYNVRNGKNYRDVRSRENTLGNLVADSFNYTLESDIAFINGGRVRNSIKKGDVSLYDLINIQPFGNKLSVVYSNGKDIMDALEFAYRTVSDDIDDVNGYIGGFLQISGIKCEIDTSIESNVVVDEKTGEFIKVDGERRVKNIMVYSKTKKEYLPLQLNGKYKVGSISYLLNQNGSGFNMFNDNEFIIKDGLNDYEAIQKYVMDPTNNGGLGGVISKDKYFVPEGRIKLI